jgi:hypothetical protein
MNMKKLIQTMTDIEQGKRQLNESYEAECGDMEASAPMSAPMPAPENQGNPVTASITLNASGMEHVADLMRLMQQAGLEKAGPPPAPTMPMRADMENLRDKMNGLEGPPREETALDDDVRDSGIEEWDNEPEEEYQDHNYMLDDLAGGLNKPKKMYKPAAQGDNPMAVEDEDDDVRESIKDRLYNLLSEKKAKPDFLDVDGDGDTEEPMKKALADKKKKGVKEGKSAAQKAAQEKFKAMVGKKNTDKKETNEAEVQAPTHELSDMARKATSMAQKIKRKINSGEPMEDRDYNQLAELGAVLSKFGASYGPRSMKDVMNHMKQYTDERNEEGHKYPEFDVNRFKTLISMATSTGESAVSEISPDLAKRYTKAAKMDRDFNDDDIDRLAKSGQSTQDMHRRNSKRTKGISRAAKRM